MNTGKAIVIYYSFEGSTKFVAKEIAQKLNCETLELIPLKGPKSHKSLIKHFWGGRQVLMKEKPELENFLFDPANYDVIFIGTPVWAWTYAPALRSFFDQVKIENKKIVLFCCNEGQKGKTFEDMKKKLLGNEILSEIEFFCPIKKQEENKEKINSWIAQIKF